MLHQVLCALNVYENKNTRHLLTNPQPTLVLAVQVISLTLS